MIKRILHIICLALFLIQVAVSGQGSEVKRVLSELRAALGGEKLAAVKTVAIEGQSSRVMPNGESVAREFEMAIAFEPRAPKYLKTEVIANFGGNVVSRRSGFSGDALIYEIDAPPEMSQGGAIRMAPMGGLGPNATPEQIAAQKKQQLLTAKREFARIAIAMIGDSTAAYPVEFKHVGVDAAKGKADAVEVTSTDGFKATLYVDATSRLPLMLSWMDKEPIRLSMTAGGSNSYTVGGATVVTSSSDVARTPEEIAQAQADLERRVREAESNRRVVEFRVMYGDYKTVDGVRMPTRIQHMIDGKTTEELFFATIKINAKNK